MPTIWTRGGASYLDHHTNEDETFVFVLRIDTPPPELESPDPILRSSCVVVGEQWPIEFIDSFEQILFSADLDFGVSISRLGYNLTPATSLMSGVLPQHVLRPQKQSQ